VTIPAEKNIVQKEAEKNLKYKSSSIEMQRMFTSIPVIIGATGTVTKSLRKNLEAIPGKRSDIFTTEDSFTWNIEHNTESTAV
jgi:hypothetical protein